MERDHAQVEKTPANSRAAASWQNRHKKTFPASLQPPRSIPQTAQPRIAQLKDLPKDSVGTIDRVMAAVQSAEGEITEKLTGSQLQTEIISLVKSAGDKETGGYRLGTYSFEPERKIARTEDPYQEEHGMPMLPSGFDVKTIDPYIIPLVVGTLRDAGQLEYLNTNWEAITLAHRVVIDVDCQFNRTQSSVGFHKDSRGTTLFFNLSFSNTAAMQGPEYYPDLEGGAKDLEEKLPVEVQKDINLRRAKDRESFKGMIESPKLPAWGRVSLSDPNIFHSTPKLGHRRKLDLSKFDRETYINYLVDKYKDQGDFTELFGKASDAVLISYANNTIEPYNTHNTESERLKGKELEMGDKAAKFDRRLSIDLSEGQTTPEELAAQQKLPRTFIRTWIRMVPKDARPAAATGSISTPEKTELKQGEKK